MTTARIPSRQTYEERAARRPRAGLLRTPQHRAGSIRSLVRRRQPDVVDLQGWRAVERAQRPAQEARRRAVPVG